MQPNNFFSLDQAIDREPLTVVPETSLNDVIRQMQEGGNSCALIVEEERLQGIFTERDLVRVIAIGGDLASSVSEIMSREIIALTSTGKEDLFNALNLMRQYHIRHLPVIDKGDRLLGLITAKGLRQNLQPINLMKWRRVEEIMNPNVIHAKPSGSVRHAAQLMANHQVSCVAIVEQDKDRNGLLIPLGIITERDIVQFQALNLDFAQPLQRLMSTPLFLVHPEDSLWTVHTLMQQRRVRRLLVAGSRGELEGIITQTSLLQVLDPTEMYGIIEQLQHQVCQLEIERAEYLQNRTTELEEQVKKRTAELIKANQQGAIAEQKIREQAALLDVTTDAIMVRGLDRQILFWNQGAEKLYGWTKEEALNRNVNELLDRESLSELNEIQQEVREKGKWHGELHQVTKVSKNIVVESRWSLVKDEAGNPQSFLVVNTDITEKKKLESQFLRAQRLESLGTLAGGIAHDLNNILAPILGFAQLLPRKLTNLDEPTLRLFKIMETNAKRGTALVKQILTFARGLEGDRGTLQIRHLIAEIRQIIRETFPKTIELEINTPKNLWTIDGDINQLHQVLMNLVVNARDAMSDGGKLTIKAENFRVNAEYARLHLDASEGAYLLITIADTGVGIPPKNIDRIFEPFFTTREIGQGTGLGLSTAIGIIKSHGGFINVYSEVERGSQFQVFLPACEAAETLPLEEEIPKGKGELILVVDDETSILEVTKATLETYNYRVLTASNGIDAIAVYAHHQQAIAVMLTDIMMPSMDGNTLIRTIKKINPHIKIVVFSGLISNDAIVAELDNSIIAAFINKPYTTEALLKTVHQVVSG